VNNSSQHFVSSIIFSSGVEWRGKKKSRRHHHPSLRPVCERPSLKKRKHQSFRVNGMKRHPDRSIKILILLRLLLLLASSRSAATRDRHLDLLALLGLQREDDDKQRFVRGAVLEDVSERVRTVRQQERGQKLACLVLARVGFFGEGI
jgi:hypothetical protein